MAKGAASYATAAEAAVDVPERFAPFVRLDRYGNHALNPQPPWEVVRLWLSSFLLLPIRTLLVVVCISCMWLVCKLDWLIPAQHRVGWVAAWGKFWCRACLMAVGYWRIRWLKISEGSVAWARYGEPSSGRSSTSSRVEHGGDGTNNHNHNSNNILNNNNNISPLTVADSRISDNQYVGAGVGGIGGGGRGGLVNDGVHDEYVNFGVVHDLLKTNGVDGCSMSCSSGGSGGSSSMCGAMSSGLGGHPDMTAEVLQARQQRRVTSGSGQPLYAGGIVSNHNGWADILVHMAHSFPSFVARDGTQRISLIGIISQKMQCLFVKREAGGQGMSAVVKARMIQKAVHGPNSSSRPFCIFPEGTTTNGAYLLPFKTGAFIAGVPLQPVYLEYGKGGVSASWDTIPVLKHISLMLRQFSHSLTYHELPLYVPSAEERASPQLYAHNMRQYMLRYSGLLPADNASLESKHEYHKLVALPTKSATTYLHTDGQPGVVHVHAKAA